MDGSDNKCLWWCVQAYSALGARLQEEQSNSAHLTGQLQDGQAAAAKLQRTIADLEQQVNSPSPYHSCLGLFPFELLAALCL